MSKDFEQYLMNKLMVFLIFTFTFGVVFLRFVLYARSTSFQCLFNCGFMVARLSVFC